MADKEKSKSEDLESGWWGVKTSGDGKSGSVKVVGSNVYFYSPVMANSILSLNEELKKLEVKLLNQAAENEEDPHSIKLHIHSYGGSVFAGISGMEAIRKSRVPVVTVVDGAAASAATFLSTAGSKRLMNRNAYMLIHQLSSVCWGRFRELKDDMKNNRELMRLIKDVYLKRTKIPKKKLNKILQHDLWFSSDKCLRYGLVDELV